MTDVSNRRREPKGIPTGGRFADEPGGSMDASDLNEPDMTPTPTITAHGHYRTIAYPGTPSATFGPYARQEGWDKAYMKAMESPHRPDDVKMLTVTGGRPYAIHDGDGVSVSVSLTKTEHVGPVFRHIGGFLEAAGRMRAENPHVIDITLRDEELSITMDDGNTTIPSSCPTWTRPNASRATITGSTRWPKDCPTTSTRWSDTPRP